MREQKKRRETEKRTERERLHSAGFADELGRNGDRLLLGKLLFRRLSNDHPGTASCRARHPSNKRLEVRTRMTVVMAMGTLWPRRYRWQE